MSARRPEEIQKMIEDLKEIKPQIRRKTFFGDDNWEMIDAQIWVLETHPSESGIYMKYEDPEDMEANMELISIARDTLAWMDGKEVEEDPISDWMNLVE